jgi:hypothetical protein
VADGTASQAEILQGIIGQPTGSAKVVVERGPVTHFADAVGSTSPIYRNPEVAKAAGFDAIPAPPTWPFAMEFSGKFEEKEFLYHRPILVGDVLVSEGKITDAYQKESKGKTMTFIVSETNWTDEATGEPVVTARFNLIHRS